MRDLHNNLTFRRAISPAAATTNNTALVSQIIDLHGYDSFEFVILAGDIADSDATITALVEHGNDASLSDAAPVPDNELLGTEANASYINTEDNTIKKIGYRGIKRYVRLTMTPANNSGNIFMAAIAVLGNPAQLPVS